MVCQGFFHEFGRFYFAGRRSAWVPKCQGASSTAYTQANAEIAWFPAHRLEPWLFCKSDVLGHAERLQFSDALMSGEQLVDKFVLANKNT